MHERVANYNKGMKKLGARFKAARLARKATQDQVAKAIGTTQAFLSMVEEGQRVPGDSLAAKMLDWMSSGTTPGKAKRGPYRT